jgi:hypothetical protein
MKHLSSARSVVSLGSSPVPQPEPHDQFENRIGVATRVEIEVDSQDKGSPHILKGEM